MSLLILLFAVLSCCSSTNKSPWWHSEIIQITGIGLMPEKGSLAQKELMAKRASKINAIRLLTLHIRSLPVNDSSKAADYLPQDWSPAGVEITKVEQRQDGSCLTTLSYSLAKVWKLVENKVAK